MSGAVAQFLSDGRRLHLQHGPIDLIVGAEGPGRQAALAAAVARFGTVLEELVAELPMLRSRFDPGAPGPSGAVARRMAAAVAPFAADAFITPMAAVAGAVADEILAALCSASRGLTKAYVNNGGDVALHLKQGAAMRAAVAGGAGARVAIGFADRVRGVATSGAGGRSHSLGIADAVTVLSASAAAADAAATLIANAVDLPGHASVKRIPARDLSPDSDLGKRLVTVAVGALSPAEIETALRRGMDCAEDFTQRGLIAGALMSLCGKHRIAGAVPLVPETLPEPAHA